MEGENRVKKSISLLLVLLLLLTSSILLAGWGYNSKKEGKTATIRVAHLVNISNMQALVGLADDTFQNALGSKVKIDRKVFNGGPEVIEALLAGEIDIGYIGAAPAAIGYIRSHGALKIIAGAANAGAVLVVQKDGGINKITDLAGKKIAVPQYGNTQDILLRKTLNDAQLKVVNQGGNVQVLQVKNPDIYSLFNRKQLDGALVPEPWGSMLLKDGKGKILLDWNQFWRKGNYSTLAVVVNTKFLEKHPDLVEKWLQAHVAITQKIKKNPTWAKKIVNDQLKVLTGKPIPDAVMDQAFPRVIPTYDPVKDSVSKFIELTAKAGYLKGQTDISGIFALNPLNKVLKEKGLPLVR